MDITRNDQTGSPDRATPEEERLFTLSERRLSLPSYRQDHLDLPFNLRGPVPKIAPNDSEKAATYLKLQHSTDSDEWFRKCLVVQRTARGIPALAPTAYAAALLTPESERIHKLDDWRRGMVGFSEDPNDPDDAGHVFYVIGRTKKNVILSWSNDVHEPGHIDVVRVGFYESAWHHRIMFAATWLNGYDFSDFNKPPEPVKKYNTLGDRYSEAIDELIRIRERKQKHDENRKIIAVLNRDIERMQRHLKRFAS